MCGSSLWSIHGLTARADSQSAHGIFFAPYIIVASLFRSVYKEQHRNGLCALISPRVGCSVLQKRVAALQMQHLAVVQLQPNLAVVHYGVVDRVRFVHPWIFLFEVIG